MSSIWFGIFEESHWELVILQCLSPFLPKQNDVCMKSFPHTDILLQGRRIHDNTRRDRERGNGASRDRLNKQRWGGVRAVSRAYSDTCLPKAIWCTATPRKQGRMCSLDSLPVYSKDHFQIEKTKWWMHLLKSFVNQKQKLLGRDKPKENLLVSLNIKLHFVA